MGRLSSHPSESPFRPRLFSRFVATKGPLAAEASPQSGSFDVACIGRNLLRRSGLLPFGVSPRCRHLPAERWPAHWGVRGAIRSAKPPIEGLLWARSPCSVPSSQQLIGRRTELPIRPRKISAPHQLSLVRFPRPWRDGGTHRLRLEERCNSGRTHRAGDYVQLYRDTTLPGGLSCTFAPWQALDELYGVLSGFSMTIG